MKSRKSEKNGVGKSPKWAVLALLLIVSLGSCEQMFTYSPLSWAQRDPSDLPDAQKIAYAESVLGSGDADAMADAYNAIKDDTDPEVQLLASQLAIGASGLNEAAEEILGSLDTIDTATINTILGGIDDTLLAGSIAAMDAAEADSSTKESISSEEYLVTAAAILIESDASVDTIASSIDAVVTPDKASADPYTKAAYYLQEAGYTSTDLEDLLNFGSV